MIVVFPFFPGDQELALKNARWMVELGGCKGHDCLMVWDKRCGDTYQMAEELKKCFDGFFHIEAKAEIDGWPQGANYFFRLATSWMANGQKWPYFLWMEPDAIPMREGWLDAIQVEFEHVAVPLEKFFMGDRVQVANVPLHLSGIAIYRNPLHAYAGEAYRAAEVAFDIAGKDQIIPKAYFTKLIEHSWHHPSFTNLHELQTQIRPETVLFHSSRDGSLIDLLRLQRQQKMSQMQDRATDRSVSATSPTWETGVAGRLPTMPESIAGNLSQTHRQMAEEPKIRVENLREGNVGERSQAGEGGATGQMPEMRSGEAGSSSPRLQQGAGSDMAVSSVPQEDSSGTLLGNRRGRNTSKPGAHQESPIKDGKNPIASPDILKGGDASCPTTSQETARASNAAPTFHPDSAAPSCDIFIRTYPGDYQWLMHCLHSIQKFCKGFRKVWVVSTGPNPYGSVASPGGGSVEWEVINDETEDGYLAQQITKLYADVLTDYQADYILHVDSDVIFTQPCSPPDFLHPSGFSSEGKLERDRPIWPFTPYSAIEVPWQPITEKFMCAPVENEFMRRFPIIIPRWLYPRLREFCHGKHGRIISEYIRTQPLRSFSEFNALGAYAYKYHHDKFFWINTLDNPLPPPFAKQFWSKGGLTPEVKSEIEQILKGGDATCQATSPMLSRPISNAAPTVQPASAAPKSIKELPSGIWVIKDDTHISKWVELQGRLDHDQNSLPFILPHIKPGDTVIDAGAFIGDHTIAYSKAVGDKGVVHAFEPNPVAYECLLHNLRESRNVILHDVGLSNANTSMPLSGNNNNYGGCYMGEHMKLCDVPVQRLDDWFYRAHIDFIKLDVEGSEVSALQGAEALIQRCRPTMVIEVNTVALKRQGNTVDDLYDVLDKYGYETKILQENCTIYSPMYDILCAANSPGVASSPKVQGFVVAPTELPPVNPSPVLTREEISQIVPRLAQYAGQSVDHRKSMMKYLSRNGLTPRWPRKKKRKQLT